MVSTQDNQSTEPAESTPSETAASASSETAASAPSESPDDAMRRRYREALERKHNGAAGSGAGHGGSKAGAATSNHKTQRTFRRKSG